MKIKHLLILILLATISGSSFIFTKDLVPTLGPIFTTELRIFIAGIFLVIYSYVIKFDIKWKEYWKLYLIMGLLNSAIPFLLYSFAALYVNASYLAIINSTSPLFASLFAIIWLNQSLSLIKIIGLLFGVLGVSIVVFDGLNMDTGSSFYIGIILCITAAAFYAISSIYIKKVGFKLNPLALATGSQMISSLILLPFIIFDHTSTNDVANSLLNINTIINILMLSIVCSALAYLLYFKLINEIGPIKTLTVTFISPFAAILLDSIFLNGIFTNGMLIGVLFIIVAILITNEIVLKKKV